MLFNIESVLWSHKIVMAATTKWWIFDENLGEYVMHNKFNIQPWAHFVQSNYFHIVSVDIRIKVRMEKGKKKHGKRGSICTLILENIQHCTHIFRKSFFLPVRKLFDWVVDRDKSYQKSQLTSTDKFGGSQSSYRLECMSLVANELKLNFSHFFPLG